MGLDPCLSFFFFFPTARVSKGTKSIVRILFNTIHALFMGPTVTLFRKKNIKNGSHGTIHTFKNYFATVFSVFSFSKNKLYSNGPLVLKEIRAPVQDANRKFKQNWASPYIIKQIYFGGVVRLMNLDANPFTEPTNMDQLKKYHI